MGTVSYTGWCNKRQPTGLYCTNAMYNSGVRPGSQLNWTSQHCLSVQAQHIIFHLVWGRTRTLHKGSCLCRLWLEQPRSEPLWGKQSRTMTKPRHLSITRWSEHTSFRSFFVSQVCVQLFFTIAHTPHMSTWCLLHKLSKSRHLQQPRETKFTC